MDPGIPLFYSCKDFWCESPPFTKNPDKIADAGICLKGEERIRLYVGLFLEHHIIGAFINRFAWFAFFQRMTFQDISQPSPKNSAGIFLFEGWAGFKINGNQGGFHTIIIFYANCIMYQSSRLTWCIPQPYLHIFIDLVLTSHRDKGEWIWKRLLNTMSHFWNQEKRSKEQWFYSSTC